MQLTEAMRRVNAHCIKTSTKVVLLTITAEGVLEVSFDDFAEKTGISARTIQRDIDDLEEQGLITVERTRVAGRNSANIYRSKL